MNIILPDKLIEEINSLPKPALTMLHTVYSILQFLFLLTKTYCSRILPHLFCYSYLP